MDIRNLETFLRIVELGNFTRAATELGYVQSTVTAQIHQMETELGFPLFDRVGKKVYLTAGGKELIPYARDAIRIMEQISVLYQGPEKIRGSLRVGVLESLMFSAMIDVLPVYQSRYKHIDIQIKTGTSADLTEMLKRNQLDMIYISEASNKEPELECCYRRKEKIIFVASREHPLADGQVHSLEEILAKPLIITEKNGAIYHRLSEVAESRGLNVSPSCMVSSVQAICEMMMRNTGMAFLPEYALRGYLADKKLTKIPTDGPDQTYYSQVLYCKGKWIPPFMQGLVDCIRQNLPET